MVRKLSFQGYIIEYELMRKRVKNINLRIRPEGTVHVSAPYFTPQSLIDRFLLSNAESILSALERLRKNAEALGNTRDSLTLRGRAVPIRTVPAKRNLAQFMGDHVLLSLCDHENDETRDKALKKLIRELAIDWVSESADRIYPIFQAMGVQKPQLKFRAMKSRWGSCRYDKASLTFNTALAHVPPDCTDYVVMHEFCHFIHPDHSKNFHALITRLMPDWKARKKTLEKYSSLL